MIGCVYNEIIHLLTQNFKNKFLKNNVSSQSISYKDVLMWHINVNLDGLSAEEKQYFILQLLFFLILKEKKTNFVSF